MCTTTQLSASRCRTSPQMSPWKWGRTGLALGAGRRPAKRRRSGCWYRSSRLSTDGNAGARSAFKGNNQRGQISLPRLGPLLSVFLPARLAWAAPPPPPVPRPGNGDKGGRKQRAIVRGRHNGLLILLDVHTIEAFLLPCTGGASSTFTKY